MRTRIQILLGLSLAWAGCGETSSPRVCDVVTTETAFIEVVDATDETQVRFEVGDGEGGMLVRPCDGVSVPPPAEGLGFYCEGGQRSGDYRFVVQTGTTSCDYTRRIDVPDVCGRPPAFEAKVADCAWEIVKEYY